MNKTTRISNFILAASMALLSACGQKGPLYLPVKPAQVNPVEIQTPTTLEKNKAEK